MDISVWPETIWQSKQSKTVSFPKTKRSKNEQVIIQDHTYGVLFVTKKELSTQNLFPKDNMSICYCTFKLCCIWGRRGRRHDLWLDKWILCQDNAPPHTMVPMRQFLTLKQILLVKHPPSYPSLGLCDFIEFPATKPLLKWTHFGLLCNIMHHLKEKLQGATTIGKLSFNLFTD
jgi:hypothetical protein